MEGVQNSELQTRIKLLPFISIEDKSSLIEIAAKYVQKH